MPEKKFFTIGKTPGYNKNINRNISHEDKLYPKLALVDLYPRTVQFNGKVKDNLKDFTLDILKYKDEDHPMKYFNNVMSAHSEYVESYNPGANYDGIRLIATIDSAINNSISHEYGDNIVDSLIDSVLGGGKALLNSGTSSNNLAVKAASNLIKGASDINTAYKMFSGNQYDANDSFRKSGAFLDALAGSRVKLPKMWTNSNVADVLQLSIKLTSPSGDQKSIKRYIIDPLIILFIMSSPLSVTGTDVGMPFMYEVDAHGLGHYKLAGIANINFDRGGTNTDFNIYQQPLTVNVRLTLQPLATNAITSLQDTKFYKKAWFQTPETIAKSLEPKQEIADIVKKIYN